MNKARSSHAPSSTDTHDTCPGCGAFFGHRHTDSHHHWRCLSCRATIDGDPARPPRWLYPLRPRAEAAGTVEPYFTAATMDPNDGHAPAPNTRTIDRYTLRGELGRGGMGVVYEAWDPELERVIALKVLLVGSFASPTALQRFIGEARTAAALKHPNIIHVHALGASEGHPYFTMDRIEGPSLSEALQRYGPLSIPEAARVMEDVARAVHHAHQHGVVHRDLKPGNVLMDCEGEPHVCDFGLARSLHRDAALTGTAEVMGTPAYMPPEVARMDDAINWVLADVYGLGAMLYATLTGQPPSQGANPHQVLNAAIEGRRPPLKLRRPEVPPALDAIVHRALHPKPEARYPSAEAFADDLARLRRGEPVLARPETTGERISRHLRRQYVPLLVVALTVLGIVAGVTIPKLRDAQHQADRDAAADKAWLALKQRMASDPTEAEALFQRFVSMPEMLGTQALSDAWLEHGDQRDQDRGGFEAPSEPAVLDDWARALVSAPDATNTNAVFLRFARWHIQRGGAAYVGPLLDVLEADPSLERELVPLRLRWGLLTGDTDAAARAWDQANALGLPEASFYADPRRTNGIWQQGEKVAGDFYAAKMAANEKVALPTLFIQPTPNTQQQIPLLDAASMGSAPNLCNEPVIPTSWIDLEQDGVVEGYTSAPWDMVRLDRHIWRGRGWLRSQYPLGGQIVRVDRESGKSEVVYDKTQSSSRVVGGDFDGDGKPELAVSAGEWKAYDLRIFAPDGAGGLRLRARAHRQSILTLKTLPDPWGPGQLLVAEEADLYPNTTVFGTANRAGPPAALVVRRLVGDELEDIFTWEMFPYGRVIDPLIGDVDGDGQAEVVATLEEGGRAVSTVILWAGEARDQFSVSFLPVGSSLSLCQLDQDPASELVVLRNERPSLSVIDEPKDVWILGRGTTPRPAPRWVPTKPVEPTPDALRERWHLRMWKAVNTLESAGLDSQAANILERLAELTEPEAATLMIRRAARLRQGLNQPQRAAQDWEMAAQAAPASEASLLWEAAVQAWLDAAMPDRALDAVAAWTRIDGKGPQGALASLTQRWEQSRENLVNSGNVHPLHPSWQVLEPLAFNTSGSQLQLDLAGTNQTLATLPLLPTGGPLALLVDLRLDIMEQSSNFILQLGGGAHGIEMGVRVGGGAGVYHIYAHCGSSAPVLQSPNFVGQPEPIHVSFYVTWDPDVHRWTCNVNLHNQFATKTWEQPQLPDPLHLQVLSVDKTSAMRMRVTMERLQLWGATAAKPAPQLEANYALANGDIAGALALLPKDDLLNRAFALARLGRPTEAITLLRKVDINAPAFRVRAPLLFRVQRATLAPLMREAFGERFYTLFSEFWSDSPYPQTDPTAQDALLNDLAGLQLAPDPDHPSWELVGMRAIELSSLGQAKQADREMALWLERWSALPEEKRVRTSLMASRLYRARALTAAQAGDRETAVALAKQSIAVAPMPELALDRLLIEEGWTALGVTLDWR